MELEELKAAVAAVAMLAEGAVASEVVALAEAAAAVLEAVAPKVEQWAMSMGAPWVTAATTAAEDATRWTNTWQSQRRRLEHLENLRQRRQRLRPNSRPPRRGAGS